MSYVPSLNFAVLQKEPQLQDIIPSLIVAFESQALGNMTLGLYRVLSTSIEWRCHCREGTFNIDDLPAVLLLKYH